jgi:hypothetical protein
MALRIKIRRAFQGMNDAEQIPKAKNRPLQRSNSAGQRFAGVSDRLHSTASKSLRMALKFEGYREQAVFSLSGLCDITFDVTGR